MKKRVAWLSLLLGASALSAAAAPAPADVLIAGGLVYDGSDTAGKIADVVLAGDKIVYVGPGAAQKFTAKRVINAKGKIVSPGFIDGHSHPDLAGMWLNSADPKERNMMPWLTQGTAIALIGVEGSGTPNLKDQTAKFAAAGIGVNLVPLVGYGVLRGANGILGQSSRKPTAEEMAKAKALVRQGMCEGGWGLSASPFNAPGSYATTEEMIELAKQASRHGGIFHNHQRDEASYNIGLLASTEESIRVGREAKMPVQITHIKAIGPDVWGKSKEVIEIINKARAEGVEVWADQYPWTAAGTGLQGMVMPRWAEDGGRAMLMKRLDDPEQLARIKTEAADNIRRRGGADKIMMISLGHEWTGKYLSEMAMTWKLDAVDAAIRIIKASADPMSGIVASFAMTEDDIKAFMKAPWITSSSDGGANHPRLYASYPRKFQKYAVEEKVISVQEFIRSSTGRPADYLHLDRRGYLKPDYFADVVVFDPQRFRQKADYVNWNVPSEGVDALYINGQLAVQDSKVTGTLAGRTLLHAPTPGSCG